MSQPARHLRVIDEEGEVLSSCPGCSERDDEIRGLGTEKRSWRAKFYAAVEDREEKARKHKQWPRALELFGLWQRLCNHPGVTWTADYFWAVEPHLRDPSLGYPMCKQAIEGAGYDAFVNPKARKNGSHKVHDDWTLIFRDADKVRDFAARAPLTRIVEFMHAQVPQGDRLAGHYIGAELQDAPR